jgi:MFS family permease
MHVRRVVAVLCLVQLIDVMGVTVMLTALPVILRDLDLPAAAATPVSASYAVLFGGCLMLGARLGDRYGHRRTVVLALLAYAAASVLAVLATGLVSLTAARSLQGVAAAVSVPSALRLLTTLTPAGEQRRRAVAAWSAAGAVAGAGGFVAGGVATQVWSWRLPFAVLAVVAVALALAVYRRVPADDPGLGPSSLDVAGGLLLTLAVMCFVGGTTALTEAGPLAGGGLLVVAAVLVLTLVAVERRVREPILSPAVLTAGPVRVGGAGSFANTATTSSAVLVTLHLQDGLGMSPLAAGAYLLPLSLAAIVGSAAAGPVLRRLAPAAALTGGLTVIGLGNLLLVADAGRVAVVVAVVLLGLGLGVASVAANSIGTDVPEALRGTAAGILNTAAQLGTSVGIAVLLLVAASASFTAGWSCAATGALGTAVAMSLRRPRAGRGYTRAPP